MNAPAHPFYSSLSHPTQWALLWISHVQLPRLPSYFSLGLLQRTDVAVTPTKKIWKVPFLLQLSLKAIPIAHSRETEAQRGAAFCLVTKQIGSQARSGAQASPLCPSVVVPTFFLLDAPATDPIQ